MQRAAIKLGKTKGRPNWLLRLPGEWDEKVLSAAFEAFAARNSDWGDHCGNRSGCWRLEAHPL